eukprot:SAG31_NODE_25065_length_468_cov_1.406504_2_plen_25_part_01
MSGWWIVWPRMPAMLLLLSGAVLAR